VIAPTRVSPAGAAHRPGEPIRILRVEPLDGAVGVLRDAPVLARFDQPIREERLTPDAFRVRDASGEIPARLRLSPDGRVAIWQAERRLRDCCEHEVTISVPGAEPRAGVAGYRGWFTTGTLAREDL
jgi:hypothetical protein